MGTAMAAAAADTHKEHEDHPWTIQIPDHPKRTETAEYKAARKLMNELARTIPEFEYGPEPYQDHHGGGLWLKDNDGWFLIRNLVGIEWSAQFCADPAKVDRLRVNARRIYAGFPEAVKELDIRELLDTPITDAKGVARWTDSICNASVPLPTTLHVGVRPKAKAGGIHHYPSPIAEIELIRRDDFQLWVDDPSGVIAAVVPLAPRGSNDSRTRLLFAASPPPADQPTPLQELLRPAEGPAGAQGALPQQLDPPPSYDEDALILPASHPLSVQAFERQA
jgi:uncharacterized protein DUF6424